MRERLTAQAAVTSKDLAILMTSTRLGFGIVQPLELRHQMLTVEKAEVVGLDYILRCVLAAE
jgi:hypothetical protein